MLRILPVTLGLAILIAAGVAHGIWTERWQPSDALREATERLALLPETLGDWQSRPYEQDPETLALAGASGSYSRSFLDPETGERVLVILLVGRSARMAVHRPEHCYQAAGYQLLGTSSKVTLSVDRLQAQFFTGQFTRDEATGPNQLKIFWSFGSDGTWKAVDNPRLEYARQPLLYKLYIIRHVSGPASTLRNDPCVRLAGLLLPVLDRTLFDR